MVLNHFAEGAKPRPTV